MENKKILLLLLFIVFLNLFLFHFIGNLALVLFAIASYKFLFLTLVSPFDLKKFITYFIPLALLSFVLLFRANGFVIFVTVLSILTYLTACVYIFSRGIIFFQSWFEVVLSPLRLFISYIKAIPHAFGLIKTTNKAVPSKKSTVIVIIKGVILSLPILIILLSLLTSADPIYGKFINNILNLKIDWAAQTVQRIAFSSVIFVFLLPLLIFPKTKENTVEISLPKPISFVSEMTVVIFLVGLALLSFLVVQFPYIFASVSKETSLSQFGVSTYSEYVRKGFIELLFAAFFVYGVVISGLFILRNSAFSQIKKILTYFQLIVLSELLIFIFSLFRRIYLYQSFHGWSLVRIYGGIFLIGLTGFTITLILRHIIVKRWVLKESIFIFFIVLFLGFFNAEQFIATTNHPPTVNNHVDYVYLSRLSPDGYLGWEKAYKYAKDVLITRDLLSKPTINKDERREIMYVRMIVNELSSNYNEMVFRFGTRDEINTYFSKIIAVSKDYEEKKTSFDEAGIRERDRLREIEVTFNKDNQKKFIGLRTSVILSTPNVYDPQFIASRWSGYSLYDYAGIKTIYPTSIDHLFMWNSSSDHAYKMIRDEIGLDNLINLKRSFYALYQKISNQPSNERDFDMDISFSSPFID